MLIFMLSLGLLLQGYLIGFPGFFVQELGISFLPYIVLVNIIIMLLQTIVIRIKPHKIMMFLLFICYGAMSFLWYSTIQENYFQEDTTVSEKILEDSDSITIFYANVYYQNNQTDILLNQVQQEDSDLVMLIEYSKVHDTILTNKLREKYPYVSRYVGSKGYDGDIIFSKYPFTTITHNNTPGSFSHISLQIKSKTMDVVLMHTSAPVSKKFFTMRNTQIQELINILTEYYTDKNAITNLMIAGDFNITPRSHYYKSFQSSLENLQLYDITSNVQATTYNSPIPYTWCLQQISLVCAHIDHIWSSNAMKLKLIKIIGSDHYGFVGSLYLK